MLLLFKGWGQSSLEWSILSCFFVLQTEDWQSYPLGSVEAQGF